MEFYGDQKTVFEELRSRLSEFVSGKQLTGSDGCVVFDNPGERQLPYGGGEVDLLCSELAKKFSIPFLRVPPYEKSEEVLESVKDQLLRHAILKNDDELLRELSTYRSSGAIVSSGILATRCMDKAKAKALMYIGPLELFLKKEYAVQDLILHLLDFSTGIFFVMSVAQQSWIRLPTDFSTWQKIAERMRFKILSSSINPIENMEIFREYIEHLVRAGRIDGSVAERIREIWQLNDDRTYFGIKLYLGRL